MARVLTCSHHAPRSGMKGVQGGKEKKKKVRYTQEGPSRFAPHAAPAMCVFLSPSACSPLLSPLSVLPFPPTPPPARSDAHLILLSADRDVCVCVCTCVRRARILYRTFVCIQISVKRVHTRVTYIGTRGIPVRVRYRRQIGDREYRTDPKTTFLRNKGILMWERSKCAEVERSRIRAS